MVMSCADNSPYVVLVLLVRRRSVADVRQLMAPQLSIPDAVERVRQQVGRHSGRLGGPRGAGRSVAAQPAHCVALR